MTSHRDTEGDGLTILTVSVTVWKKERIGHHHIMLHLLFVYHTPDVMALGLFTYKPRKKKSVKYSVVYT